MGNIDFKVKNKGGQEVELSIISPSVKTKQEGQIAFNRTFNSALNSGALLRESITKHMEDQGLWDKGREEEYKELIEGINEGEKRINKGGIKLSEGKDIAVDMQKKRGELQTLLMQRNSLDVHSVQGQAQQSEFEHFLYSCLVYTDSREGYFESKEVFEEEKNGDISQAASIHLMTLLHGSNEDFLGGLPENQFLKKWNFVNKDLRFINQEGNLVDSNGKLVDTDGRLVDGEGNFVDKDGNPLDEDGNYAFETAPFLDDEGVPIVEEGVKTPEETDPETVPEEVQSG